MPHVRSADLPSQSHLNQLTSDGDFLDCYAVSSPLSPRKAAEVITTFPGWAKGLLQIRRIITAPFGLHNDAPDGSRDVVGIFPVELETADELIAGFDDRHLNFRVAVRQDNGVVRLATWVHPHNLAGRAYLALIMPFHIMIARNALARVASS